MTRRVLSTALLALLLPWVAMAAPTPTLSVGRLILTHCNEDYDGYCGTIERPLDPVTHHPGRIEIGFEYYPRRDLAHPSAGTILTEEGGPGYSSTGTRDAYVPLYAALREHRDVLIIDKRGTGTSGAIDCPQLQNSAPADASALKACARQLGSSAWYYGSALAAADVVAVLDALEIEKVDYYGDSYGTYFGQTLAARFPDRLRSIVLDSAYPVRPSDPWFPTDWATARDGYDTVCRRSPSCRDAGIEPRELLKRLLQQIRTQPISGTAPDADGNPAPVTLDAPTLFVTLDGAGNSPALYRDFPAAAVAWLHDADAEPLLRLAAEVGTGGAGDYTEYSAALYQAVTCQEYPLLYRLSASPQERRVQYRQALGQVRERRAGLFAPFTIQEALASHADITPLDTCLDWPAPPIGYAQGDALPANPVFPRVPTLVLSGDLDSVTSPADASEAARQFPVVTHLLVPNLTHITAFSDEDNNIVVGDDLTGCVSGIVRHFVEALVPGDVSCIPAIRPIRTVPRFARYSDALEPADAEDGNRATTAELRWASAAAETVGDAIARFFVGSAGTGAGLRGGTYTYAITTDGYRYELDGVRWTDDLSVSGSIDWNQRSDEIRSSIQVSHNGRSAGSLEIRWCDRQSNAVASIRGSLDGHLVRARRAAP